MTVVHEEEERNNDNKIMASNIISIIDNQEFWMNLVELEKILYPYCAALNLLQKDKARLYDVLHSFGYFMQCTLECDDENYKEIMTRRLERRWKTWEQPLLILSFFLHPSYKLQFFASSPKLSHIYLDNWVQYYYIKWFNKEPTSITQELLAYKETLFPFNASSLLKLDKTPLEYWLFLNDSVPELSQVAVKLFSICVNSASCERLFSSMGFLHTKRQNKLNVSYLIFYITQYINIIIY